MAIWLITAIGEPRAGSPRDVLARSSAMRNRRPGLSRQGSRVGEKGGAERDETKDSILPCSLQLYTLLLHYLPYLSLRSQWGHDFLIFFMISLYDVGWGHVGHLWMKEGRKGKKGGDVWAATVQQGSRGKTVVNNETFGFQCFKRQ